MKLHKLLPLVFGLAGIALGIYLGRGPLAPPSMKQASADFVISGSILQGSSLPGGTETKPAKAATAPGAKVSPLADALLGVINNPSGQAAINQFYQMLGRMPSQEVANLIVDVDAYPNHSRRRETREMIIDYLELSKEFPEIKGSALSNAFSKLASDDLALALEKAREWKDDPQYMNIMQNIASGYGRTNPEEALKWANGLDETIRSSAVSQALGQLSNNDPDLAIKHLNDLEMAQEDPVYQNAVQQIAGQWAAQDPVSAAEWIDTLSNPDVHTRAVSDVADRWAGIDPVSASEWISTLEAGPARDQAAQRLVNRIEGDDPEMAAAWAASIGDENARNNALSSVFSRWIQMDPAGARAAIEASPLPDGWKDSQLQQLQNADPPAF